MGLPNYIVNLDELADILLSTIQKSELEYRYDMGYKGLTISHNDINTVTYITPNDIILTSIDIKVNPKCNIAQRYDYTYSMMIDNTTILNNKIIEEYDSIVRLRQPILIKKGSRIRFNVPKYSQIDAQFLFGLHYMLIGDDTDISTKIEVHYKCNDKLLEVDTFYFTPPTIQKIYAKNIEGYELIEQNYQNIKIALDTPDSIIEFQYRELPPMITVYHYGVDYKLLDTEIAYRPLGTIYEAKAKWFEGYENVVGSAVMAIKILEPRNYEVYFYYKPRGWWNQ